MFIQVAVNVPQVSGVYDYHLPEGLENKAVPGCLVVVPFGRQKVQGIIMRQVEQPQVLQTRPVTDLLDEIPVVNPSQIQLAAWLSRQTISPLAECLHMMLPPGLSKQSDTVYIIQPGLVETEHHPSPFQQRILDLLTQRGGKLTRRQLAKAFSHQNWKSSAAALVNQGILYTETILQEPTASPKLIRTARLTCSSEDAEQAMPTLGKGQANLRRQAMLSILIRERPHPVAISWVYAAAPDGKGNMADLKALEKKGLISLGEEEEYRDPVEGLTSLSVPEIRLTAAQQSIQQQITSEIISAQKGRRLKPFLLQGVTGSGKTEIYLQTVQHLLNSGKQAIILIPEISLTPQTVRRFTARFPGRVGITHSRLSDGERYDTWRRARSGDLSIIIGPRSALFTNMPDLGLIIVDEFEDDTYYQSEHRPHYAAVRTALAYGYLKNIPVILGSATPDISWKYRAEQDGWRILNLPSRVLAHQTIIDDHLKKMQIIPSPLLTMNEQTASLPLPPVQIVDMREELKEGNRSIFSRSLQDALNTILQKQEQAILYLNRRGSATYVFCRNCGKSLLCPNCGISLTYHESVDHLLCHTCSYQRNMPKKCPSCGSPNIRQYGTGTEKVEKELQGLLPHARILRLDAGTTGKKEAYNMILENFNSHQADILVGTQMLAKGLDLPLVTLVGVILADVGLHLPDFRANERVFQLLTQVAGRAGRSPLGGKVILQTFDPDHYVIQAAANHDFEKFYQQELEKRRKIRYPPFYRLARLEFRHLDENEAKQAAMGMAVQLQTWIDAGEFLNSEIVGPVPCYFQRRARLYRWQVILRSPDPVAILKDHQYNGGQVEIDPPSLL